MYKTSDEYLRKIASPTECTYKVGGTIDGVIFDGEDIVADSIYITGQASDSENVKLGGVFITNLEMTFARTNIPRGSWRGKTIYLEVLVDLGQGSNKRVRVPFQPFVVTSAEHTEEGVEIKASDYMVNFDRLKDFDTTSGFPFEILQYICRRCSVKLGITQAEVEKLPNGDQKMGMYGENDIETYRDALYWLAQALGCFATINRDGELVLRRFTGTPVTSKAGDIRFEGGRYSDFETYFTGLSVINMADNTVSSFGSGTGTVMELGANPFLQYGTEEEVEFMRNNILREIKNIRLTPFTVETVPDPAMELGDVLTFPGYIGAGIKGCVMAYEYHFNNSLRMEGFGQDPRYIRSKADKETAGVTSQSSGNSITYYQYINSEEYEVGTYETTVAEIRFTAKKDTEVDIWHELKLLVDRTGEQPAKAYVNYYFDETLVDYHPIETWNEDGYHMLNLNYHAMADSETAHDWTVTLRLEGGTAEILPGDVHVVLSGQGLVASKEWDGLIKINETLELGFHGNTAVRLTEEHSINMQVPISSTINEHMGLPFKGRTVIGLNDVAYVTLQERQFLLTTSDGRMLTTDDGQLIRTDGGT